MGRLTFEEIKAALGDEGVTEKVRLPFEVDERAPYTPTVYLTEFGGVPAYHFHYGWINQHGTPTLWGAIYKEGDAPNTDDSSLLILESKFREWVSSRTETNK